MLRPFPQYSGVTDVYGNVAGSTYHSLQLTLEKRRSDDGLTVSFNYTFSRTEDNLAARTGYDFDQDWAVGVNDQPHVWNAMVVYNMPFGAEGKPGSGNRGRPGDRQGLAGLRHHAVPIGPSARHRSAPPATCRTPARATRISTRTSAGPVRINGDYGDGDVLGTNPPTYIDRNAFQSPAAVHVRQHAADARARSAQPELLQPGSQRPARFPDRAATRLGFGVDVFNLFNNVVFGGIQTNITNANFGRVSSQTNTPRVGQIKVRLDF